MKSKRPLLARPLGWSTVAVLQLHVQHEDRRLQILIAQIPNSMAWSLVALESKRDAFSADAILAEHAHVNLGEARDLPTTMATANTYADKWQRAQEAGVKCECGEIEGSKS